MKKVLCYVLVCCFATLALAGCAKSSKTGTQGKQVTLKYVFGGISKMKDSETVWKQFNEKLQEYLPNTSVEFEVIPYSDYAEKWKLISASRETVDLVWVGWMLDLYEEVSRGSLMPLDDLLQHVPDLKAELPELLFNLTKVKGQIYCIPNYQMMTTLPYGVKTHAQLAEKYLDAELVTKTFDTQDMLKKEDYKVFEDYLKKLKDNGEIRKGVSGTFLEIILGRIGNLGQFKEVIAANAVIDWRDKDVKVYDDIFDFPEHMAYYEIANDWYKKGYIRKEILSIQDVNADDGKENGYVLWSHSVFKDDSERATKQCGFPVLSIPTFQHLYIPHKKPTTNTGISQTTQDAVRSIKLLELLNTKKGKDLYNMLIFGMEGKHYNKVSENEIEWLDAKAPGKSSDNKYGYDAWAIGNTFNAYSTQFDTPGWNDYILNDVNKNGTPSPLIGFSLNTDNIKLEIAQYEAIMKEYDYLKYGVHDNYEELIAKRNEKLKNAGSDKIIAEVRRQIDEWKKTRK